VAGVSAGGSLPEAAGGDAARRPGPDRPESTSLDRWAPAFPQAGRPPARAAAPAAAGPLVVSAPAEPITADRWLPGFPQAGRAIRRAAGPALAEAAPAAAEGAGLDRWIPRWTQPGRTPRRVPPAECVGPVTVPAPTAGTGYHIYRGDSAGGAVDYTTPIGATAGLSFDVGVLPASTRTRFGVRAYDLATGLEERNTDAVVEIVIGAAQDDQTLRPSAPGNLTARAGASASIVVSWTFADTDPSTKPTGFRVYAGTGGTPDYTTPAATAAYSGVGLGYRATLAGLVDGTEYTLAVRAYNAHGEEDNAATVAVTADGTPPLPVLSPTATATAEAP
jgi:hypothetical protein